MNDPALVELLLDPALQEARVGTGIAHGATSLNVHPTVQPQPNSLAHGEILQDYNIAVERAQTWTGIGRFGFNAMLASPDYKNKLRLSPTKLDRIVHFVVKPNAKSREKDRDDAQAKHQAKRWSYTNGILYRRESKVGHPLRHVGAEEVFDILTAEHLQSGHHGRDKMLKVLEAKYIGYTKEELMYVLDHCQVCASKYLRGAVGKRRENKNAADHEMTSTIEGT